MARPQTPRAEPAELPTGPPSLEEGAGVGVAMLKLAIILARLGKPFRATVESCGFKIELRTEFANPPPPKE